MSSLKGESEDGKNELHYVHMENLPWTACYKDIEDFFKGIYILPGSISIYYEDAFVVFSCKQDLDKALEMDGKDIQGNAVRLTNLERRDVCKNKCQKVCRALSFQPKKSPVNVIKRIRPTFKTQLSQDMFSIFNPVEVTNFEVNSPVQCHQSFKRKAKRKIKPTLLKEMAQIHVFESLDSESCGHCVKKLKLNDNWHLSHLGVV